MYKLRSYQEDAVNKSVDSLTKDNNMLLIAPTGSGKTIMLSHVINKFSTQTYVLSHRKEINTQNYKTYKELFNNELTKISEFTAENKNIVNGINFCMVQTLHKNLETTPIPDMLVIDEAHHARADTYVMIIDFYKQKNKNLKLFGVTATPTRSDGKGLEKYFNNVYKEITLLKLIEVGALVRPIVKIIDVDTIKDSSKNCIKIETQEQLMIAKDTSILEHWKNECSYEKPEVVRQTIGFTNTIRHAQNLNALFKENGVRSGCVSGDMNKLERNEVIEKFRNKEIQVLFNANILTEGFDNPETSCVMLIRPSSSKNSMVQMVGRGLRHSPNKDNCLILDFGKSIERHKNLFPSTCIKDVSDKLGISSTPEDIEEDEDNKVDVSDCVQKSVEISEFDLIIKDVLKTTRSKDIWVEVPFYKKFYIASGFNSVVLVELPDKLEGADSPTSESEVGIGYLWMCSNKQGYHSIVQDPCNIKKIFEQGALYIGAHEQMHFPYIYKSMIRKDISTSQKRVLSKNYKHLVKNKYEAMCLIHLQKKREFFKELRNKTIQNYKVT